MTIDPRFLETAGSQGRAGAEAELLDLLIDGHNNNFAAIAAIAAVQLGQRGNALDIYSVTTHGADPTGFADSTMAVRAALAAAWANVQATERRSVVFFPAGVFRFITKTVIRHVDIDGMTNLAFVGTSSGRSRLKPAYTYEWIEHPHSIKLEPKELNDEYTIGAFNQQGHNTESS